MKLKYLFLAIIFLIINYKFFYLSYLSKGFTQASYEISIYFIIFVFITFIFSFSRILNRIWLTLLFLISLISIYFVNTMGIEYNRQIIENIINTNLSETTELLNTNFVIYIAFVILLMFIIYKIFIKPLNRLSFKSYLLTIIILPVIFFSNSKINEAAYKNIIHYQTSKIMPLGVIKAFSNYIREKSRYKPIIKKDISNNFKYYNNGNNPIISVLIIGESARADRFSINGYKRNTTPNLLKIKSLISFKNALSCETSTISSVPCLVSRVKHGHFKFPIKETSFVKIFTQHGFDTYWLSLQDEAKQIHTFCEEANSCEDLHYLKHDMDIINRFNNIVKSAKKDTLIVIHTMGSHIDYNKRVPKEYQKFQPICNDSYVNCNDTLNNSYDNTIYYTDIFLSTIIHTLENKNSFLLYASDHGESLGEKYMGLFKRYGHASPYKLAPKEQTHIPFIAWFSKIYKNNHMQVNKISNNMKISHDNIFSSMLGCAGFKGKYIDEKLNICSIK